MTAHRRALIIRAAGGVLWRRAPRGAEVVVVHRPRHRDWSLPKGKLEPRERWSAAALREVAEETACTARLAGFAGWTFYLANGRPKLVLFWDMALVHADVFAPGDEIDEIAWLEPAVAITRLDHASERHLLRRALRRGAPPGLS